MLITLNSKLTFFVKFTHLDQHPRLPEHKPSVGNGNSGIPRVLLPKPSQHELSSSLMVSLPLAKATVVSLHLPLTKDHREPEICSRMDVQSATLPGAGPLLPSVGPFLWLHPETSLNQGPGLPSDWLRVMCKGSHI